MLKKKFELAGDKLKEGRRNKTSQKIKPWGKKSH